MKGGREEEEWEDDLGGRDEGREGNWKKRSRRKRLSSHRCEPE